MKNRVATTDLNSTCCKSISAWIFRHNWCCCYAVATFTYMLACARVYTLETRRLYITGSVSANCLRLLCVLYTHWQYTILCAAFLYPWRRMKYVACIPAAAWPKRTKICLSGSSFDEQSFCWCCMFVECIYDYNGAICFILTLGRSLVFVRGAILNCK